MATGRLPDPNTAPVTAKGDLYTYSTVPAKLAVGNNGETLVADSSTTTGLRWQVPVNVNPVLNSAFQIWQRGTTSADSAGSPYTADRWQLSRSASSGATVTRQVTGDTTNLPFIQYCARVQRNSGNTSTNLIYLSQTMESINSIPYAGRTVTLSYYVRAGANYSATSSTFKMELISGTGTDQSLITGFTGQTVVASLTHAITSTWQRFSFTGSIGSTATQLALATTFAPTGTAGANDWYEITGVQLEVGSVATPFKTNAATLAGELAACQRYYYKHPASGTVNTSVAAGGYYTASTYIVPIPFPVTMRVAPTFAVTTVTNGYSVLTGGGLDNINSLTQETANTQFAQCYNNTEAGSTIGYYGQLISGSTSTSLAWSAEL